ncbi:MAG TPA: mismatch-specific DNA-glycosylase [Rhodanobacteraceae bacterium]|nr:mismatch-specific DNA-glycosylase [Rhodanobacteraceae bacterium]
MVTPRARSHVLPDVLRPDLELVFCGTAAGRASAAAGAYYAHPGNFFWRTVHAVGLITEPLAPRDFRRLPESGIGLTDLAKHHAGNDDELPTGAFDVAALRHKILRHAPRLLAFTSKNAAQAALGHAVAYGLQDIRWETTALWVLPSPSGQARRFWDERPWRALAAAVRAPR